MLSRLLQRAVEHTVSFEEGVVHREIERAILDRAAVSGLLSFLILRHVRW